MARVTTFGGKHTHGPECGKVRLVDGPYINQGFWGDEWDAIVAERQAFAPRAGRRSPYLDYVKTTEIKDGFQLAVYKPGGRS